MKLTNRSELRKKCMTILYQIDVYEKAKISYIIDDIFSEVLEIDNEFVKEIVYGVLTYKNELDKLANRFLRNWTIDRLGNTDRAILRIGLYELQYTAIPKVVAINEAVELAKLYSDDSVRKMINGVLDAVYQELLENES